MSIIDFHNHLIPRVDDGAQSIGDARDGVAAFVADGVTAFVATPHFDGGLTLQPEHMQERLAEIDEGWDVLRQLCQQEFPQVRVLRGVELLLDVPEPDLSDPRVRIDGGRFFLMEFPFMMIPPQSARVVGGLSGRGYTPIIAHPERYQGITSIDIAGTWREAGALLQVNAGSLLGRYGSQARKFAFDLLQRGWVDFISSDYHARGGPMLARCYELLVEEGAEEQARTLMSTNPARMLAGELPLPSAPLRETKRTVWQRVSGIFR
jgi:protein-tyrosine phosphatase